MEVHQENLSSTLLEPRLTASIMTGRNDQAEDLSVFEKVRLQKEQERQRLEKKKEKKREKKRERLRKKQEAERERQREEHKQRVEREGAERQRVLDQEQARVEKEERDRIAEQQNVIKSKRELREEEREWFVRLQKETDKVEMELERLQEEERERIMREQRKVQQEWEGKENSVMAACQKIYSTQLHRAELAFQKLSQNPSREGVLRYALEDSKVELALVELEVARDIKTHGQEHSWMEAQTQRLMEAQDKLQKARQSLSMLLE